MLSVVYAKCHWLLHSQEKSLDLIEQHVFFTLIIEDNTEKVLQFVIPEMSIYIKNLF